MPVNYFFVVISRHMWIFFEFCENFGMLEAIIGNKRLILSLARTFHYCISFCVVKWPSDIVITSVIYLQRWTERLVRGCEISHQSFRKWQIGRWGLASVPWQHYSGKCQNSTRLLVQLCMIHVATLCGHTSTHDEFLASSIDNCTIYSLGDMRHIYRMGAHCVLSPPWVNLCVHSMMS